MSGLCVDTETMVTEALDASVRETFDMMIGKPIDHVATRAMESFPVLKKSLQVPDEQVTVVVGLSGLLQGSVSVCVDEQVALSWTRDLIQHETEEIDQVVVDAIGELGNMVVGGAKGRLSDFQLKLGLPCVLLTGKSHLAFPTNCQPFELEYRYGNHSLLVFVALSKSFV